MAPLMQRLSATYEVVLIDGPAILEVSDSLELSRHAGCALLVVSVNHIQRRQLAEALASFETADAKLVGLVINEAQVKPWKRSRRRNGSMSSARFSPDWDWDQPPWLDDRAARQAPGTPIHAIEENAPLPIKEDVIAPTTDDKAARTQDSGSSASASKNGVVPVKQEAAVPHIQDRAASLRKQDGAPVSNDRDGAAGSTIEREGKATDQTGRPVQQSRGHTTGSNEQDVAAHSKRKDRPDVPTKNWRPTAETTEAS
jgi:hypothetical protein